VKRIFFYLVFSCLFSCGPQQARSTPQNAGKGPALGDPAASSANADENAEPPPPGPSPDAPFPTVARHELPNGFGLRIVERHSLPVVEIRLVVRSGHASDEPKTGLSALTGSLLETGGAGRWSARQQVERAEGLGARLEVVTDRDATQLSIAVARSELEPALELLSTLAQSARFDAVEFRKLRDREIERVTDLSRTSSTFMASMVLYRELYELPSAVHPYARFAATSAELKAITLEDCRGWYRAHFSPKNAFLVVAGDVVPDAVLAAAARLFEPWKGEPPARGQFPTPHLPNRTSVYVVDRPASAQSQVYVGLFGPEMKTRVLPAALVMNQILAAERLFLDVREKRALSHRLGSEIEKVAEGPVPIVLNAVTQSAKTARTVAALLEQLDVMATTEPRDEAVGEASRYLADSFLVSSASAGAIANLTARLGILELPDDWYDDYRRALRQVEPAEVRDLGARYLRKDRAIIAVAGAADVVAEPLRRFGPVTVVDAEHGFSTRRSLTHDPSVALDPVAPRP
jgi:zinc protease